MTVIEVVAGVGELQGVGGRDGCRHPACDETPVANQDVSVAGFDEVSPVFADIDYNLI